MAKGKNKKKKGKTHKMPDGTVMKGEPPMMKKGGKSKKAKS